jgi:hypothetical protein
LAAHVRCGDDREVRSSVPHLRLVGGPGLKKARVRAIESRLGEIMIELGRIADEVAHDDDAFRDLSSAVCAMGRARQRLRER